MGRDDGIANLVQDIAEAEAAFERGDIHASLGRARSVVMVVDGLERVTDAPLYLVSWAHHIQGRAYQAMTDRITAVMHYRASLTFKVFLHEWLPPLSMLATEIKLGAVEILESPAEAIARLMRVTDTLTGHLELESANQNLYRNLLADSRVTLAEAFLEIGLKHDAAAQARAALDVTLMLNDHVGEIRTLHALWRAAELSGSETRIRIGEILERETSAADHPRVVQVPCGPR